MSSRWDFHAHLVPGLDDGARDFDQSLQMLRAAASQGVTDIVTTPHLRHAQQLEKAQVYQQRLEQVRRLAQPLSIRVHRGYEVNYRLLAELTPNQLGPACLENSRLLLLELPTERLFPNWESVISSLVRSGYQIMLAHPERYLYFQEHPSFLDDFLSYGLMAQIDAAALYGGFFSQEKHTAMAFLKKGRAYCLASDAHSPREYQYLGRALAQYGNLLPKDNA